MGDYVFEGQAESSEWQRLRLLEEAFDGATERWLAPCAVLGTSCLEIGAGAGGIARWLAARVGPAGRVKALDRDTRYLGPESVPGVAVAQGELGQHRGSYQLVHARYVFIHNRNAAELLQGAAALVAPGGALVVEEPDFLVARWVHGAHAGACNRVNLAIAEMFRVRELDPGFGSLLGVLAEGTGLRIERLEAELHLARGGSAVARVMGASAAALREAYVTTGYAAPADVDAYVRAAADPREAAIFYATVRLHAVRPE